MIALNNINFSYGENNPEMSLKNINLTIKQGEMVLLCGESGCGKTTITRMINGLIPRFFNGTMAGEVVLNETPLQNLSLYEISKKVGSVFQNPRSQFFNVDTTSELAFGCENHRLSIEIIKQRVEQAVRAFKIEELMDQNIFNLSGGEKQKIAFASVFATLPEVFVLDEPSANLDVWAIADLTDILRHLKESGKTIIISEHRLYYLKDLVDRAIYMKNGEIEQELTRKELCELDDSVRESMGLRVIYPERLKKEVQTARQNSGVLSCENFRFSYHKKEVLQIENLDLPLNEVIAVIGHNGAGKSTFIRCLCGLERKCPGRIKNNPEYTRPKQRLKKSYLVMQDTANQLFTESVEEELCFKSSLKNGEKLNRILQDLDLEPLRKRHPLSLSGGQKQRVAIAGSMVLDKELVILDEPTSGLDYTQMNNVASAISELQKSARIIVIVTHDLELILKSCTTIIQMEKGQVAAAYHLDDSGVLRLMAFFTDQKAGEDYQCATLYDRCEKEPEISGYGKKCYG